MDFADEEDWDLDLIHDLVRKEEEAIAAKRDGQLQLASSIPPSPSQVAAPLVGIEDIASLSSWRNSSPDHSSSVGRSCNVNLPVQGRYHRDNDSSMEGPSKGNLDASRHNSMSQTPSAGRSVLPRKAPEAHYQSMGHDHSWTAQPLMERDYLISELRTRLFQADQELSQLRRKAMPKMGAPSSTLQQKEIERLKAQVLFKDQELLEARRACADKSEQLKRIVSEIEYLRKESGEVEQIRQWMDHSDAKHMEETKRDNVQRSVGISTSDAATNTGVQDPDHWLPPWTIGGTSDLLQVAPRGGASVAQNTSLDREDSLVVAELKARTFDNGSTSMSQKESRLGSGFLQVPEICPRNALMPSAWGFNNRGEQFTFSTLAREVEKRTLGQSPKCLRKLLKIWSSGNVKRDCSELISKLFAVCQADMQVLLSIGLDKAGCSRMSRNKEIQNTDKKVASDLNEDSKEVFLGSTGALELHFILAKMANGLASSWTLFMAVVELCTLESVPVVESALRVLHCILIHDCNCRSELFGGSYFESSKKKEGWMLSPLSFPGPEAPQLKDLLGAQSSLRVVEDRSSAVDPKQMLRSHFSSPRVYCQIGGSETCQVKEHDILHNREECKAMDTHKVNGFQGKQGKTFPFGKSMQGTSAKKLFGCVFSIVLKGASQSIRVEAMAILNVLVMDTEPMIQRAHFGSVLFDGSITSLFRKHAGLDVQVQAVRLVHIILHCPLVLQMLCASEDTAHDFAIVTGQVLEGNNCIQDGENNDGNMEGESGCNDIRTQAEFAKYSRKADSDSKAEVLEGLISCLHYNSGSLQEYALRRSALRVLAFVATSGHKGAATLLATKATFFKEGSIKQANKERIKDEELSTEIAGSLPVHLISLLDKELRIEEEDDCSLRMAEGEERDCLIREALTLICRLASHPTQSTVTLAAVTVSKALTRLSICITNRLISRSSLYEISKPEYKSVVLPSDMVDLARGLRRRILASVSNL